MKGNKLGDIISNLRKERNLTQKELADELCVSDKSVSRWENGSTYPNIDMIYIISKYFGVSFYNLLEARMADDNEDDEVVDAVINEFHRITNKGKRRLKYFAIVSLIIAIILIIAILFINSYNKFKVYKVNLDSEDFIALDGIFVDTKIKDELNLGNLNFRDIIIDDSDLINVDLYYIENGKEYILRNYSSLNNINFSNYDSYIKINDLSKYIENLYIRVTISKDNDVPLLFNSKLNFILDFSNNKIFNNSNVKELTRFSDNNNDIETILLNNGYEKINEEILSKNLNNYSFEYVIKSSILVVNYKSDEYKYNIKYSIISKELFVQVFNNKNIQIENYYYYPDTDEKKCNIGSCNNYKEIMNIINDNFLNLIN